MDLHSINGMHDDDDDEPLFGALCAVLVAFYILTTFFSLSNSFRPLVYRCICFSSPNN